MSDIKPIFLAAVKLIFDLFDCIIYYHLAKT